MRIDEVLARTARRQPHMEAWVQADGSGSLTYAEAQQQVDAAAAFFQARGVQPGDRVALLLGNTPGFLVAYLAALRAGATAVPLNIRLSADEVAGILRDCQASLTVTEAATAPLAGTAPAVSVEELTAAPSTPPAPVNVTEDSLADILYTSGTSGKPKGVEFTHRAALQSGWGILSETAMRPGDRVLQFMPLTHSAPLHLMTLASLLSGATQVLGTFNPARPRDFFEAASRHRITHTFAAPVAYLLGMKAGVGDLDFASVRCWMYGGGPVNPVQLQALRQAIPGSWMQVYGLTEAGPNGTMLREEDHAAKLGSIGWRAMLNAELRLMREDGQPAGVDEVGEVQLRAESMMRGYHNRPDLTREVMTDDGWLKTGDLARRDQDGYLWIMGRARDLIVSGGVNIYPQEVEEHLATVPGMADVAVIGLPHPEWGEVVCAVVVYPSGEADLGQAVAFLEGKLAPYKWPRLLRQVDALPRNANGKVMKQALRETLTA